MEERLYQIIRVIKTYMQINHNDLYVSREMKFIGYKYHANDKYYLFFVSIKQNHICLTLRDDISSIEHEVVYIDDLSDYKILSKIETFLYRKTNNMPIYISHGENNSHIDGETIYDQITKLEKNINKEEIIQKYGNITLDKVSMSNRLYNGCIRNNVKTLANFLTTPILNFSKMQWLGRKTLKEVANIKLKYFDGKIKEITYKQAELNQIYYHLDKLNIKAEITEEEYEAYIDFGIKVGSIVNEIVTSFYNKRNTDIFRIRMNFTDSDSHTLEDIGLIYGLTRERIRQIINKIQRRLCALKYKYRIIEEFNAISGKEDLLNYILIGIYGLYNEQFLNFITSILDSKEQLRIIAPIKMILRRRKDLYVDNYEAKILELINYHEHLNPDAEKVFKKLKKERETDDKNNNGIQELKNFDTEVEYESGLEKLILLRLNNCKFIKNIKAQSLLIKYDYNDKTYSYYPDFQILTKDNKLIVMEIKPSYNMMDKRVMIKYKALEKYCINNGFGYLMIDERYNTYEKLKNLDVDKNIEAQFINMMQIKKEINYPECKLFVEEHNINMNVIASIVINNCNLIECTFKPFKIKLK